ncbi:MAG: HAD family hydrolase [Chloroflexi bacterium]|nr:HAD family hydrolase [Chloroflexota bacterium]
MIRLVLFDIDGTLIRTGGAGVKAFERTFATEFNVLNATQHVNFAGRTDPSLVRECFGHHRIEATPGNFRRFFDAYVFWLQYLLAHSRGAACAGVREFIGGLELLPQPPRLGLLTGNIRLGAEIKLRHFDLWDHFQSGAFGDDHEDRNQLAFIAQQRGSRLLGENLNGDQILVIGDTPLDIACARAIHARVLAVATGGCSLEELSAHRPTWCLASLRRGNAAEFCQ